VDVDRTLRLYRNDTANAGKWLTIKLDPVASNRDGIGTLVKLIAGGKQQMRQVLGGSSGHGQDELLVHFGLGTNSAASWLGIYWPSGIIDQYTNVPANALFSATEQPPFPAGLPAGASPDQPGASWTSVSGTTYRLQLASQLHPPGWTDCSPPFTSTTNGISTLTVETNVEGALFFRVIQIE
jgi:hypothetical protein